MRRTSRIPNVQLVKKTLGSGTPNQDAGENHHQDDMKHFFGSGIPIKTFICHCHPGVRVNTQHIPSGKRSHSDHWNIPPFFDRKYIDSSQSGAPIFMGENVSFRDSGTPKLQQLRDSLPKNSPQPNLLPPNTTAPNKTPRVLHPWRAVHVRVPSLGELPWPEKPGVPNPFHGKSWVFKDPGS